MLKKIHSCLSTYPSLKEEEVVLQSWNYPNETPFFFFCTYSILLTALLFGSGLVEMGFIEHCWTAEVAGGMCGGLSGENKDSKPVAAYIACGCMTGWVGWLEKGLTA